MGCHMLLGVPRRNTSTTVPVATQNVLPLSATVTVSIRIAGGFAAAQECDAVAGADADTDADADADAGADDGREAVGAVAAGWLAHPVRASALMIAVAAQSGIVRMPVSFPGSRPERLPSQPVIGLWRTFDVVLASRVPGAGHCLRQPGPHLRTRHVSRS